MLILSGDHIYKMDYMKMLDFHKKNQSDCTIAVINVPIEEASRFGIMNTEADGRIYEFEEKPPKPKSTKASMGIYIFNCDKLKKYLTDDAADPKSSNDFGKNVIPAMLAAGERMFAYEFSGYWKDVGTIQSLWEANMDILGLKPVLDLYDRKWRIFSRTNANPPQYIGDEAVVTNSVVGEGCEIRGTVENSVLFEGVRVAPGARVRDSVIMDGVVLEENACVEYAIVDSNTVIEKDASIGAPKDDGNGITLIGSDLRVSKDFKIKPGDMVNQTYLDEQASKGGK